MRIAKNVEMLEIEDERGVLNSVLVWDDKDVVLLDAGYIDQLELYAAALGQIGFALQDITKVIISHQDLDHTGIAKHLRELGAQIIAHEVEAPYIQGDKISIRITDMQDRLDELTDDQRRFYDKMVLTSEQLYVKVDRALRDNEVLDCCGGIKAIHTPGHLPGHLAVLLLESNVLFTGDATNLENGVLVGPSPNYTMDMPLAQLSVQKMLDTKPQIIVCYHGGFYDNSQNI